MELLRDAAPDAIALVDGAERWTYARLRADVAAAAAALGADRELGFVLCRNDAATVIAYLAALAAGHPVALFDADLDADFRDELIARYRPGWIARGGALERRDGGTGALHPELALLLSTSGTTGSPKLVRLRGASVEHNARAIVGALGIDARERAITTLPLHYSYGLSVLNSHLAAGATIVLSRDGLTAQPFWDAVRAHECTSLAGVPYSYQMLRRLDLERLDVPSVMTLTQAGGALDPTLVAHFHALMQRRGGRFFVMYGQTEATARIAVLPAEALPAKLGSVGRALDGGALAIEDGEVVYRGPNVMMGYALERADLARGDEQGGVLRTGDLGRLDDDGFLTITGRSRRIAKVFGLRLNLDEVEALLRPLGPVAAIGGADKLYVYCEQADDDALAARKRLLVDKLRINHSAVIVRAIDALPLAASGKVDYARLPSA